MARLRGMAAVVLALLGVTIGQLPAAAAPTPASGAPTQSTTAPAQPPVSAGQTTAGSAQPQVAQTPLAVVPARGRSGTVVTISSDLAPAPTTCTLEQDGKFRETFPCGPKNTYRYAITGSPGRHTLAVCTPACVKVAAAPSAAADFFILAVVPRLIGLTKSALPKVLAAAGLRLGTVTGPIGSPVTNQDPPSGRVVDPGQLVDVGLGPDVTTTVGPRGNVRFVQVPDIRGHSLAAARDELAGVGLVMSTRSTSGTVATQNPQPGRRVATGTTVTVTIEVAASTTASATTSWPGRYWAVAVAVLVLLALAGGFTARRLGHRRPRIRRAIGPPPRITCRTTVDVVHTRPTGLAAPVIDLRVLEHSTLTMERKS